MTVYTIDGRKVSVAEMIGAEDAFTGGHTSYIWPVYRSDVWIGWAVYVAGEAVGKVFGREDYKLAAQLLEQIRSEA
jgi:hypothetical protein